jgi:hypothetical protein
LEEELEVECNQADEEEEVVVVVLWDKAVEVYLQMVDVVLSLESNSTNKPVMLFLMLCHQLLCSNKHHLLLTMVLNHHLQMSHLQLPH